VKFTKKEKWVLGMLIGIPIIVTILLAFPRYESFYATGDIEPVRNLGVDGNVYFTYIEGGVTTNTIEKILVHINYMGEEREVRFRPMSPREIEMEMEIEEEELGEEFKETVISNAIDVSGFSEEEEDSQDEKYASIIEKSSEYDGDSFGLMVTIGLVEEETGEDFSRGGKYKIAGTGTMEYDGVVGSIDGIREKLLTAEEQGVTHFFVPKDKEVYSIFYEGLSNQEEAEQHQLTINPKMKIVPVETLEEALDYLHRLP
jgi:Lon-like protease